MSSIRAKVISKSKPEFYGRVGTVAYLGPNKVFLRFETGEVEPFTRGDLKLGVKAAS